MADRNERRRQRRLNETPEARDLRLRQRREQDRGRFLRISSEEQVEVRNRVNAKRREREQNEIVKRVRFDKKIDRVRRRRIEERRRADQETADEKSHLQDMDDNYIFQVPN